MTLVQNRLITYPDGEVKESVIRPLSAEIDCVCRGNRVTFTIDRPPII